MKKKINLGCGSITKEGYINIDINYYKGVDLLLDLYKHSYPFEVSSIDFIYTRHCLEHLDSVKLTLKEMCRVLKEKGTAEIIVPHFTSNGAFQDLTHKHFFAYHSFDYFQTQEQHKFNGFMLYTKKIRLVFGKKIQVWNWLIEPLVNMFPDVWEGSFLKSYPAIELRVVLEKRKC